MSEHLSIEITPNEVKQFMDTGTIFSLVDCREPDEYEKCRIDLARLIPLSTIPDRVEELEGSDRLIVYCHLGVRSLRAANWLRRNGIANAQSMSGGIDAWSTEIDPKTPRY